MSEPESQSLETAWDRHRRWSAGADREKKSLTSWRRTALVLGSIGAVLETGAAQAKTFGLLGAVPMALALSGALALALVSVIIPWKLGKDSERRWIRARSISEKLKSEIHQYLARAVRYRAADRDDQLRNRCGEAVSRDEDLAAMIANVTPVAKSVPSITGIDDYVELRVTKQIDEYYKPAARREADAAQAFRNYQFGLALFATLLGVVAGVTDSMGISAWVAVVTTIAGSVAAHSAAGRYDYLSISYTSTASHLEDLRDEFQSKAVDGRYSDADVDAFVGSCESTISVENQAWMGTVPREIRAD